ncbi:hypothetical protein [Nonomuraea sp. NPDC001023]|uniref:hypothetical protein n=1 Tax=unclassified Nonomuraea TaxID=2593643 RepID=UPI00332DB466
MLDLDEPEATPVGCLPKLLTGVIVVLLLAALTVVGLVVWAQRSMRSHLEEGEEHDRAFMSRQAAEIVVRLEKAAADGSLPDKEIHEAVYRFAWHAERPDGLVRIVVKIPSITSPGPP